MCIHVVVHAYMYIHVVLTCIHVQAYKRTCIHTYKHMYNMYRPAHTQCIYMYYIVQCESTSQLAGIHIVHVMYMCMYIHMYMHTLHMYVSVQMHLYCTCSNSIHTRTCSHSRIHKIHCKAVSWVSLIPPCLAHWLHLDDNYNVYVHIHMRV